MPVPYAYGPSQFTVQLGQKSLIRMNIPERGALRSLVLQQVDGTASGTLEIYDSEEAARLVAYGDDDASQSAAWAAELSGGQTAPYRVMSPATITAGTYAAYGLSIEYRNRDHTDREPARCLWLVLDLDGTGDANFVLSAMVSPAEYF